MKQNCKKEYLITKATKLIMRRPHSVYEIRKKLSVVCSDTAVLKEVIEELEYLNLLNDKNFTEAYIQELITKQYGPHKLRQKLYTRGISRELINEALSKLRDIDFKNIVQELLSKKQLDLNNYNDRNKAVRFLLNRGFDMDDIMSVIGDNE